MLKKLMILGALVTLNTATLSAQAQGFYPNPGIIGNNNGKFTGSDHLLNVSSDIQVAVEIFKPDDLTIDLSTESLKSIVSQSFARAEISTRKPENGGEFNLPFFHVLIMMYPIHKGYAISCQGRLFEEVEIKRVQLSEGTALQAITWESQNLIISPTEELSRQVPNSVEEIANTFAERYSFYKGISQGNAEKQQQQP